MKTSKKQTLENGKARWRTESVKAYGNAIVPEVARRIFECIDQLSED